MIISTVLFPLRMSDGNSLKCKCVYYYILLVGSCYECIAYTTWNATWFYHFYFYHKLYQLDEPPIRNYNICLYPHYFLYIVLCTMYISGRVICPPLNSGASVHGKNTSANNNISRFSELHFYCQTLWFFIGVWCVLFPFPPISIFGQFSA